VTDHGEQLREAFESHEHLAPDAAVVYARVKELSRAYQRRRLGAQAAGGTVLGAGLIAAMINLPGLLPAGPQEPGGVAAPAGAPSAPSASPALSAFPALSPSPALSASAPPSARKLQKQWDAYFAAGYDYDDALALAQLWNSKDEVGAVKAEAGRRLLAGDRLPFAATPEDSESDATNSKEAARVNAFFARGYDHDDAAKLAELWKLADPYDAKVEASKKLLAGENLPIQP